MARPKRVPSRASAQRKEDAEQRRKADPAPASPAGDGVRIRTSERRDFKRCPQRWWWSWVDGLHKRGSEVNALWFGTGVHHALATWYGKPGIKRGEHPAKTWAEWCGDEYRVFRTSNDFDETTYVDARSLGIAMLEGYVDTYGTDEWMEIIAVETPFQIMVQRADGTWFEYDGTFDGVYRDKRNGEFFILEHKTAKQISFKHLSLDDQAGSYLWVATEILRERGVLGPKQRLSGITYNFLRKQMPDDRPKDDRGRATNKPQKEHYVRALEAAGVAVPAKATLAVLEGLAADRALRVLGEISKQQPLPNFEREFVWRNDKERVVMAQRVVAEERSMAAFRSGMLPLFKTPTRDCSWDCAFFELCELHEQGGDWEEFRDTFFKRRDPYADHRKSAAEAV